MNKLTSELVIEERNFEDFFLVPFKIYDTNFPFVSELKSDLKRFLSTQNPLFPTNDYFSFWTARRGQKLVGRIVAHIHLESNKKFNWNKSYFGYFDVENNQETANALLTKALEFGKKHKSTEVVGNFNLTAMQKAGVVTNFFEFDHYTDQIINPLYTPQLLENFGFERFFPMTTFKVNVKDINPEKFIGPKEKILLSDQEYTFEYVNKKNIQETLETMKTCINHGMALNPWSVPLTNEEIYFQAKDLMLIIDEKISIIAKHNNKPIGVFITIPDMNPLLKKSGSRLGLSFLFHFIKHKLKNDRALGIIYSVFPEYQSKGLNAVMMSKVIRNMIDSNYKTLGSTWIADENISSLRQIEKLGAQKLHRLHLFRKEI